MILKLRDGLKSPLLGRGLGRGGDYKSFEQKITPSLEFVSSHLFANKFFSLPRRDRHVAFTLAEVLITLGIIGVVAAVTMPTLIKKYQQHVTVNKVKKFYTNMNQILMYAKNEYGDINSWDNSTDFYNSYIKPYIKNVENIQENIYVRGDFDYGVRVVFSDGTQVIISADKNKNFLTGSRVSFIYYTNAKYYTDEYGLDIKYPSRTKFYFVLDNNYTLSVPHINKTRAENLIKCAPKDGFGNNGYADCSTVIYKDGWKISDDYPW